MKILTKVRDIRFRKPMLAAHLRRRFGLDDDMQGIMIMLRAWRRRALDLLRD